jgi:ribose transport system ATP-binding protein
MSETFKIKIEDKETTFLVKMPNLQNQREGQKIYNQAFSDAVKSGIGYLSEDRKKYGLLLIQNVTFNVILSSIPSFSNKFGFLKTKPAGAITRDAIKQLSIRTPSENQYLKNLSGGNQQKVLLGRWFEAKVQVLLLVEPTRGVDVGARRDIYDIIRRQAKESGMAVLVATSDYEEVVLLADRALVVSRGEISAEFTDDLVQANKLIAASG